MKVTKNKGGRNKRAEYTTSVVRVPDPVKTAVEQIIAEFYDRRTRKKSSDDLLTIEECARLCELMDSDLWVQDKCNLEENEYEGAYSDEDFRANHEDNLREFCQLADKVNSLLFKFDSTFDGMRSPSESYDGFFSLLKTLIEYRLVVKPKVTPASLIEAVAFTCEDDNGQYGGVLGVIAEAIRLRRLDIIAAIYDDTPIDRKDYWHKFYTTKIGMPDINYWEWRGNPEAFNICPELSDLLSLPKPPKSALEVLKKLALGKDPFYHPHGYNTQKYEMLAFCSPGIGHFASYEHTWNERHEYLQAFAEWNAFAIEQLGTEKLIAIYRKVFNVQFNLITQILAHLGEFNEQSFSNEQERSLFVLGLGINATPAAIKAKYRSLAKKYHPDLNKSNEAQVKMQEINKAYEYLVELENQLFVSFQTKMWG